MRPTELTFVILAKNEAARLQTTLNALPVGVSIFVLDAESDDDTAAIARAAGAECEIRAWTNFVDARRYALARVRTPWAFMLDADEQPDAALAAALLACSGEDAGYRCRRENWFCGRPIRGGAWADERLVRLVRVQDATVVGSRAGDVHESLQVRGSLGELAGKLIHDSYPTRASYWQKFVRYTDLEAATFGRPSLAVLAAEIPRSFARAGWHFVGRGGFRDGWRGAFIAGASALYPLAVRWKAWRRVCT